LNVSAYLSIPALTPREVNAPGTSRLVYGAVVDIYVRQITVVRIE